MVSIQFSIILIVNSLGVVPMFPDSNENGGEEAEEEAEEESEEEGEEEGDDEGNDEEEENSNSPVQKRERIVEISHLLAKKQSLASNTRVVGAMDAGVRYPIAVAAIHNNSKNALTLKVRKSNLYTHETTMARQLEFLKAQQPAVGKAEAELATGSKRSLNAQTFIKGYFEPLCRNRKTLVNFYGSRMIRNLRFGKDRNVKKLYDKYCTSIFGMLGVKSHAKVKEGEIIFAVGDDYVSTNHKNRRPSKHATFWRYFIRKVQVIICW